MAEATPWVVVLTHGGAEWQAFTNLTRHGVEALLPYTIGNARRGHWVQGVVRPTYPGYLFAQLSVSVEKIRKASGVRDLLRFGERLVYVSAEEVESCRAAWLEAYREALPHVRRKIVFQPGEWVRMVSGPFEGLPVRVERVDKSGMVCASLGKLQVNFHQSEAAKSERGRAKPAGTPNHRKVKPQ